MAGSGQRFIDAGYKDPKPAIVVDGKMIVEYIIDIFPEKEKYVFICNEDQKKHPTLIPMLEKIRPHSQVLTIPTHKKGPVFTVLPAFDQIPDDEPVIVAYCDGAVSLSFDHFKEYVDEQEYDGCLLTHTGFHPHNLSKTKMAYVKTDHSGFDERVTEVKEKASYTENPQYEHASSGVYYFRTGAILKKYFQMALDENVNYNGECYITLVYNLLIRDGLKVGYYDTDYVLILGTPEEVQNYEAWLKIIRNPYIKNVAHLAGTYNYWNEFVN